MNMAGSGERSSSSNVSSRLVALFAVIILWIAATLTLYRLPGQTVDGEDTTFSAPTIIAEWSVSDKLDGLKLKSDGPRAKIIPRTGSGATAVPTRTETVSTTSPHNATTSSDRGGGGRGGGMHLCNCLRDDDPRNANLPDTPKRLRWLHIPKTGTSFITTLWSYAASTDDRYIDLNVNSHFCSMFDNTSYSMYDFVLMRRYPWELYGARNMIPSSAGSSDSAVPLNKDVPLGLVGGTQHMPLSQSLKDERITKSRRYQTLVKKKVLKRWGSELLEHNMTVAAFFRQPEERIVSAYYDGRHANGLPPETWKKLIAASVQKGPRHACNIDGVTYTNPLECFARYPGVAGCMARMLSGEMCADGALNATGLENVPIAVDVVMNHLDFVGLTEDWNESICQFHRLFAGKLDKESGRRTWDAPLQGEFGNVHKSLKRKDFGVEHLRGFKDVADNVVYEAVKLKFERMVGSERCYEYVSWDELENKKSTSGWPHLRLDSDGKVCRPRSCTDLGKQCGEWDDGCGKTIICGMCNVGRTGLPSTWRVKCVEGQCVDYCPPWDAKGYWSLSDDTPPAIKEIRRTIGVEEEQEHLLPTDAVLICQMACNGTRGGFERFVGDHGEDDNEDGLCRCGKSPQILKKGLSPRDFSKAHDLTEACAKNKARVHSTLAGDETQPICCPYIHQKSTLPNGWKRLFSMGSFNLEGEYFYHVSIECGAFLECERVARAKQAEMAVFDMFNSYCYLMRNLVDLGSFFTVTKDNQYRYAIDLR